MLNEFGNHLHFNRKVIWTDEATFKLTDILTNATLFLWNDQNPHIMIQTELNSQGICI
jgi:hypothetical protein